MKSLISLLTICLVSTSLIAQNLADQVTIRRTDYGVPHITGENLRAVAFGLAYAECEDRGEKVILPFIKAKGTWAKYTVIENIRKFKMGLPNLD